MSAQFEPGPFERVECAGCFEAEAAKNCKCAGLFAALKSRSITGVEVDHTRYGLRARAPLAEILTHYLANQGDFAGITPEELAAVLEPAFGWGDGVSFYRYKLADVFARKAPPDPRVVFRQSPADRAKGRRWRRK